MRNYLVLGGIDIFKYTKNGYDESLVTNYSTSINKCIV